MLAQRVEVDFGEALLRQAHVVGAGAQIRQGASRIERHGVAEKAREPFADRVGADAAPERDLAAALKTALQNAWQASIEGARTARAEAASLLDQAAERQADFRRTLDADRKAREKQAQVAAENAKRIAGAQLSNTPAARPAAKATPVTKSKKPATPEKTPGQKPALVSVDTVAAAAPAAKARKAAAAEHPELFARLKFEELPHWERQLFGKEM